MWSNNITETIHSSQTLKPYEKLLYIELFKYLYIYENFRPTNILELIESKQEINGNNYLILKEGDFGYPLALQISDSKRNNPSLKLPICDMYGENRLLDFEQVLFQVENGKYILVKLKK